MILLDGLRFYCWRQRLRLSMRNIDKFFLCLPVFPNDLILVSLITIDDNFFMFFLFPRMIWSLFGFMCCIHSFCCVAKLPKLQLCASSSYSSIICDFGLANGWQVRYAREPELTHDLWGWRFFTWKQVRNAVMSCWTYLCPFNMLL